ncbi:Anthranilate synthase component 1 [Neolecta irregularis DAH-3]|uniref:anthranilate synthase n=1 Tax=Neolecta irregularis (strain DAH-3) TaxID=1198029 RepID=A0A1U7LPQ4_NEOID|nr:Anthranilate synthase component 1 [Neolecta irregularis DAH-3]|eukprot:OLL24501.1 Anthranilate synthase component 1 [Neolecta irregularis DAH-3]
MSQVTVQPELRILREMIQDNAKTSPTLIPVYATVPADSLTTTTAYLKLARNSKYSFLLESATGGEHVGRYSFIGADPHKVITSGKNFGGEHDPLIELERILNEQRIIELPVLPPFPGGAMGYVSYDCVKYFEPKVARPLKDPLGIPESLFMFYDWVVVFDNFYQEIKIIVHVKIPQDLNELEAEYDKAQETINLIAWKLDAKEVQYPIQPAIVSGNQFTSNIGQEGYESHVLKLKEHIKKGDVIQAVPSQRLSRPTSLHPFNVYRNLRRVNPCPYMFYIDCGNFQVVGASPELLVKQDKGRIYTHPIAGTVHRGKTLQGIAVTNGTNNKAEDDALAAKLLGSAKDRAEHVMLVDLARNDVNRVCDYESTRVDRLMDVERYSHVMHLVSEVSGVLRPDKTRFDAFRSIFPAGTVSGAPKVRAMELIAELEGERRGVYAGAVGRWGYDGQSMDTCIALRTMVFKDGVAYLQAGGGIVHDSDPHDEYEETLNKLKANIECIAGAERRFGAGRHTHACGGANEYSPELSALKLAALFVILATATLAALSPIAARHVRSIHVSPLLFFVVKHFGTGVILATAFIHIMPGAFSSLNHECLGSYWTAKYSASPGAIMMAAAFFIFFVQYFATRYLDIVDKRAASQRSNSYSSSSTVVKADTLVDVHADPAAIGADGQDNIHANKAILQAQILGVSILEAGIVFHSLFIGMTLMVTGKDEFTPLFIAVIFHQTFEGLGLGTRIAALALPRRSPKQYLMALTYGISTPIGCAIGFGLRKSYDPASATSLIVQGIFDSISAGLLLYAAIVELLAHDFFYDTLRVAKPATVFAAIASLLTGAAAMALIGAWA